MVAVSIPPRSAWDQGDVVEEVYFPSVDAKIPGVLMMPACDLDLNKVFVWTFVALFPDLEVARDVMRRELEGWRLAPDHEGRFQVSSGQRDQIRKRLKDLLRNRYPRYHWLPVAIGAQPAHVADFSQVTSLPVEETRGSRRVCSLISSWREEVQARYAAYMGRVGTEDHRDEELTEHVDRLIADSSLL